MSGPVEAAIANILAAEIDAAPANRAVLAGLAERRMPSESEIDAERRFGMLRAGQGVPLEDLVSTYHRDFRRVWEQLVAAAGTPPPDDLLDLADLLWCWLPMLTSAAADGYQQASRAHDAHLRRDTGNLVDLLRTGQAGTEACRSLAHTLGFDPDGNFHVVSIPEPDHPVAAALDARLRCLTGVSHWVARDGRLLVISQGRPADEVGNALPGPAQGASLVRPGLSGAAEALIDADNALDLAIALGRPVSFAKDWLWITMQRHLDRLRPLLGAGRPADQPRLGEVARAYGDGGWSIAGAAENLGLHPNTVRYRLDRLGQLANLDPRSIAGQRLSVLQDLANEVDRGTAPGPHRHRAAPPAQTS